MITRDYPKELIWYSSGKDMVDKLTNSQVLKRVWQPKKAQGPL